MKEINEIDNSLFSLLKGIDVISMVSPINYHEEKEHFFSNSAKINPDFHYRQRDVHPFDLKQKIFQVRVSRIKDPDLRELYENIIESYVGRIDLYQNIGTDSFLYESLRYFGEPNKKDIANAQFLLHIPDGKEVPTKLDVKGLTHILKEFADNNELPFELHIKDNLISNALASGLAIKVNKYANLSELEAHALAHHELGVHMVTTINARSQPLKLLSLGCPGNTKTQEGLAILAEYLSGNQTISRLKILALRVIAVQSMINDRDFKTTFSQLKEQYLVEPDLAFTITARAYRGGGLTKDYLYLQGFHQMLHAFESMANFNHLVSGKVSIESLPLVTRLINKEILHAPKIPCPAFKQANFIDPISSFIAHAIK